MDKEKMDRRVRRTKKQLRAALTTLMMEKSVGEITVREIAEAADVNRGTFYAHYKDVGDLLAQLEENIFVRLQEISVTNGYGSQEAALYGYLRDILTLCGDNSDVYKALICRNNDLDFQQRLFHTLKSQFMLSFLTRNGTASEHEIDMYCSFVVSGMLSITKDWMNSGLIEAPEEMARFGASFILRGLDSLRGGMEEK